MNLLTNLIDIEYYLIYLLDYKCFQKYACLSKANNQFLKNHIIYKLLLKYLKWAIDWASENGHVKLSLKYDNFEYFDTENEINLNIYLTTWASKNNHIEILKWLKISGSKINYDSNAIDYASKKGARNLNQMKFDLIPQQRKSF